MPRNASSEPIGTWQTSGTARRRSRTIATHRPKSAPALSSLFTYTMRGTRYASARAQLVSVCGSTPATASSTTTAPSSTRRLLFTSMVKSRWPGVSMTFRRWTGSGSVSGSRHERGRQSTLTAADWIVIPRSRSCWRKSVTAAPSCTSPILCDRPAWYRTRSVVVVLPASTWAMMPTLRMRASGMVRAMAASCACVAFGGLGIASRRARLPDPFGGPGVVSPGQRAAIRPRSSVQVRRVRRRRPNRHARPSQRERSGARAHATARGRAAARSPAVRCRCAYACHAPRNRF